MKRLLIISKDGERRGYEDVSEEIYRELRNHPLWNLQYRKLPDGNTEIIAQLKSEKRLAKDAAIEAKALKERIYGRQK